MPRNREVSQIGYSHIRVLGKIYQVEGYVHEIKSGKRKLNKKFIELKQMLKLVDGEWKTTIAPSFRSPIDREWRIWHEHEFVMGSLGECMDTSRQTQVWSGSKKGRTTEDEAA